MRLIPTDEEVVEILKKTGALREGHFEFPFGLHSNHLIQMPLAMRYYRHARMLSVALSRLIRANPELRAITSELSIVAPATGGLPVAFGVCEALQAHQVYWAERDVKGGPLAFRPHLEQLKDEPVVLVDDLIRSGRKLTEMRDLIETRGARVVAIATLVSQPTPHRADFNGIPFYSLATVHSTFSRPEDCPACKRGEPVEHVAK